MEKLLWMFDQKKVTTHKRKRAYKGEGGDGCLKPAHLTTMLTT